MAKQEHEGTPLALRHSELGPQGEGTQGSLISSRWTSTGGAIEKICLEN